MQYIIYYAIKNPPASKAEGGSITVIF